MKRLLLLTLILVSGSIISQNALHFDGVSDHVQFSKAGPTGISDRTVEAWIKTSSSISTQMVIVDWGDMATGHRFTLNMLNFGKLRIEVGGNGFNSTKSIADGLWHHVAVTYSNNSSPNFVMYIDGVPETSANVTVAVNTSNVNGIIIGRRNDATNYFNGTIDEVRVWNVERSATEILNDYNKEFCTLPPNMVAYMNFSQGNAGAINSGKTVLFNAVGTGDGSLKTFALNGSTSNWVTGANLGSGLTIKKFNQAACDSVQSPSGKYTWTTSGTFTDTMQNAASCDSLITVNLSLGQTIRDSIVDYGCEFYESFGGKYTWTTTGVYYDTLLNPTGCKTYYTYDLDITNIDTTVTVNGGELESKEANSFYQWINCTNGGVKIANANKKVFKPTKNGEYAVVLTKDSCIDTSACIAVNYVGIAENELNDITIWPNPARNVINIQSSNFNGTAYIEIISITGQVVVTLKLKANGLNQINVSALKRGLYFLKEINNGVVVSTNRLILQ